jgi:hypothetical protein
MPLGFEFLAMGSACRDAEFLRFAAIRSCRDVGWLLEFEATGSAGRDCVASRSNRLVELGAKMREEGRVLLVAVLRWMRDVWDVSRGSLEGQRGRTWEIRDDGFVKAFEQARHV